jgi:hypothetical protein
MDNLAFHCTNIHCCLQMIVLHKKLMLLKPIIQKLRLGRLEKLYRRFNRCWEDEVSWKLFRFYSLQYKKGLQ